MSLINPDWIDPIESTFDEGRPIRQEQGLMLAGNPIAMAPGKPGAPIVEAGWHPYDATKVGGGDGVFWDFNVDGDVSIALSPLFEDGFEYHLYVDLNYSTSSDAGGVSFYIVFDSGDEVLCGSASLAFNYRVVGRTADPVSRIPYSTPKSVPTIGIGLDVQKPIQFKMEKGSLTNLASGKVQMLRRKIYGL